MQIATATTNSYVPNPHTKVPASLKRIFFIGAQDGENKLSPIKNNSIVFHGPRNKKQVALTFDADMTPWMHDQYTSGNVASYYDEKLIDELKETHTPATLFLTGMWIELYPYVAKELAANPLFELGNHSYSHPSFSGFCYGLAQLPQNGEDDEIDKTQSLLFDLTKKQNTLFRFPGGCYSQDDIALLHTKGLTGIQWDVVGDDGFNDNGDIIQNNIFSTVQNGSIIVMHMNGVPNDPVTDEVLPNIISTLKQRGYEFVTVSQLLAPPPKKELISLHTMYSFGNIL
ncbi:MAG: polysaccharide deacetylase family protein [Candidatus Levyibacteriota bacterium]